jgi:5-methyltetrahydrofolate corrinoid/iron sulfur protein methyltransferase
MTCLIGENIFVTAPRVSEALKGRDAAFLRELAAAQAASGMDMLDLNIGPARKGGAELMRWLVNEVAAACPLPLSLDTTNIEAIEAGLAALAQLGRGGLINSCSVLPERLERLLPLAARYNQPIIALMWGPEGLPRDANERGALAAEFLWRAAKAGVPPENIWIDPVLCPIKGQQEQLAAALEFLRMLPELAPGCRTTCGLSNISNGVPAALRGWLNRTYLIMLRRAGLTSAIVSANDAELVALARGQRDELERLVHRVMDGDEPRLADLSPEEAAYAKSARVLLGRSLFSDSWLEVA